MTGSVHDADDLVQETFVRALRGLAGFEARASLRTWLYRIATNACLTALDGRRRRALPSGLGNDPVDPQADLLTDGEVLWLEPFPTDPTHFVETRESIRLAFVAALQHLPARQRAVLVLRDVLQFPAAEVAEIMNTTVTAVNSSLQRAHSRLESVANDAAQRDAPDLDSSQLVMLDEYVDAFWEKDIDRLVALLTADATWEMPPFTSFVTGAHAIGTLIDTQCPGRSHDMRMIQTSANGQVAFALYMRGKDEIFRPFHIQVLTLSGRSVSHVAAFFDTSLFRRFGLPESHNDPALG